jgi:FimV-like protein
LFYKANALLKLERAKEAVPLLLEHLKTKDSLTEKTNWYLALAYLKLEDKAKAEKILEKVIADGNYKASEAQKLLKAFK